MNQTIHTKKRIACLLSCLLASLTLFSHIVPIVYAEGEFIEFFEELLFGSGAWFGLILILGLTLVIAYIARFSSLVFMLILIFMGFNYLNEIGGNIAIDNSFAWAFVIDMLGVLIMGYIFLKDCRILGKK